MRLKEYLGLMDFPQEWIEWEMIPESFVLQQASLYKPGNDAASEHDRHAVFQWWLRQEPKNRQLLSLARLTWLDSDPPMAASVREQIYKQPNLSPEVSVALATPYHRA